MTKKAKATVAQEDRIRKRMGELKRTMRDYCVGQDELVDIVMLAAISKQHVILFGPPGCNKSRCLTIFTKLIGADKQNLNGASSKLFRVTLDKWATPEALFGPFSPKKLTEEDRWVRNTEHTLADCDYALIEELFSANGSTLRSAVVALNERAFDNAGTRLNIPLRSAFASTNEEPHQSQAALYDRFLFRAVVDQIEVTDTDAFSKMLVMSSENEDLNDLGHILTRKDIEIAEDGAAGYAQFASEGRGIAASAALQEVDELEQTVDAAELSGSLGGSSGGRAERTTSGLASVLDGCKRRHQ